MIFFFKKADFLQFLKVISKHIFSLAKMKVLVLQLCFESKPLSVKKF